MLRSVTVAAAAAFLVAGCGSTRTLTTVEVIRSVTTIRTVGAASPQTATPTTTTTGSQMTHLAPSAQATSCLIRLDQHDAMVKFGAQAFDVAPECQAAIRSYGSSGEAWSLQSSNSEPLSQDGVVCFVSAGGVYATVFDDGGQSFGEAACAGLKSTGWVDAPY